MVLVTLEGLKERKCCRRLLSPPHVQGDEEMQQLELEPSDKHLRQRRKRCLNDLVVALALVLLLFMFCFGFYTLVPNCSLFTSVGGLAKTLIGAYYGRPLWTAPLPQVTWENVELPAEAASPDGVGSSAASPSFNMFPLHVWPGNASRTVTLADGRQTTLKVSSVERPRAFLIEGLLDAKEQTELREAAFDMLRKSPSKATNRNHPQIGWIPDRIVPAAIALNKRTAALLKLPEELFERTNLTATWYANGGEYLGHHDAMSLDAHRSSCKSNGKYRTPGGPRFATIVYYLTDVQQGGETLFPHQGVTVKPSENELMTGRSCSGVWGKLTVPAKAGTAIMWYNYLQNPDGSIGDLDWAAFHRGCAVLEGSKLIVTRFVTLPLAECEPQHKNAILE